jgi:GNAT superfamily N-acetyltransferase
MIRSATKHDVPQLLQLMKQLAVFEGYAERFSVTEQALLERGFNNRNAEFSAFVNEEGGLLNGYAITYIVPFTYDLLPTVVLKELFVAARSRNKGVGHALFTAVQQHARIIGARLLRWQVLPTNSAAMQFYQKHGGNIDSDWQHWVLEL